jgi:hypothetical protein
MMFEVDNLEQASPATVSRCGMVFLEPDQLGWRPLASSWILALPETDGIVGHKAYLTAMFDWLVPPLLSLVNRRLKNVTPVPELALVTSLLSLLGALFADAGLTAAPPDADTVKSHPSVVGWRSRLTPSVLAEIEAAERVRLEALFVFAAAWSLGGSLDAASRPKFDAALRRLLTGRALGPELDARRASVAGNMPSGDGEAGESALEVSDTKGSRMARRSSGGQPEAGARQAIAAALPPLGVDGTSIFDYRLDLGGLSSQLAGLGVPAVVAQLAPLPKESEDEGEVPSTPAPSPANVPTPSPSPVGGVTAAAAAAADQADAGAASAARAALAAQREALLRSLTTPGVHWTRWSDALVSTASAAAGSLDLFPIPHSTEFSDIIVPTVDR